MAIEYLGLSEINGPLVVLEGVKNASFEEIVEFHMDDGTQKIGRIIEIYEDKAVIQVFEGTDNMSLGNTHTRLTGHPMEIGLSPEILGRTFNGIGQPIDGLGAITPEVNLNINGLPLNPVTRAADCVVDIGPGAGEHGGELVEIGTAETLMKNERSITGAYLSGRCKIPVPTERKQPTGWLKIRGAA